MKHLNELFDNMDSWRHLPAYQLERRADIFFSIYLPDLLFGKFGVQVEAMLPEFPIRKGTIGTKSDDNRSDKIDYLIKVKDANRVMFVELKTDDSSRRSEQDSYLEMARQVGFNRLLDGVREIYKATSSKGSTGTCFVTCMTWDSSRLKTMSGFRVTQVDYDIQIVYILATQSREPSRSYLVSGSGTDYQPTRRRVEFAVRTIALGVG